MVSFTHSYIVWIYWQICSPNNIWCMFTTGQSQWDFNLCAILRRMPIPCKTPWQMFFKQGKIELRKDVPCQIRICLHVVSVVRAKNSLYREMPNLYCGDVLRGSPFLLLVASSGIVWRLPLVICFYLFLDPWVTWSLVTSCGRTKNSSTHFPASTWAGHVTLWTNNQHFYFYFKKFFLCIFIFKQIFCCCCCFPHPHCLLT